ncbi:MAG: hypothetical protein AAGG01_17080, partial [Planctomycetota bacterium]
LGPARQFQYYTTASALSPEPLRDGFTFSYQSSTENFRRWDLQTVTSSGQWGPLLGYAQSSELYHFGTLLTRTEPDGSLHDWFLGVKYYNLNNAGFGQLQLMDMADAGINEFIYTPGRNIQPEQITTNLTMGVISDDEASPRVNVDSQLVYVGKLSTPRAGRIGGEYLAAYTPTSANRWKPDATGDFGEFQSHIVYRPNMEPFAPYLPYSTVTGNGAAILVKDRRDRMSLMWPTPVLSWMERHGTPDQDYSDTIVHPNSPIDRGLPYAEVGTSAIWNTDLRPFDCFYGTGEIPFNPNDLEDNDEIELNQSIDGLRYVQDPNDLCQYLLPDTVLGIQVNMTSNRPDWDALWAPGYETDATRLTAPDGEKEASRILGVFDVTVENTADQSFMARIPADVPFDFHLLDSTYGMKLVDVRSWHSLQPRERRHDCGGCHQHERGFGIPFDGTEASQKPALDMAAQTSFYSYDPNCQPTLQTTTDAAVSIPEWTEDIWPEFSQKCGTCHDAVQSNDMAALAALDFTDEESAYRRIHDRNYANTVLGALGSPVFWAAYGQRTDGRDNSIPNYQPNYAGGNYGFHFSSVHPGLCDGTDPAGADWVHRLGLWIDNHMPRNTGASAGSAGYQFDRFHPTVDFAYTEAAGAPNEIRIGFWDDEGVVTVEVYLNGALTQTFTDRPNGEVLINDGGLTGDASIRVVAIDAAGNRQIKEKTIEELRLN